MKRQIKALFLSAAMAFGIVFPTTVAQGAEVNGISTTVSEVAVGGEFEVALNVPATENADTAGIRVEFDGDAFSVTEWSPSLSGQVPNSGVDANGVGFFTVNAANATRAIDLSKGLTLTAKLKVKDDAAIKDYTFTLVKHSLSYYKEDTYEDIELWEPTATSVTVSVKPIPVPATGITLNKTTLSLAEGKTETLTATVSPSNSTDTVSWKTGDSTIATVDKSGKVTAVKLGTTTITATAGTKSATCTVTVTCAHKNTTDVPAKDSTCKEQGNGAYTKCNDCGTIISGSDEKLELADHAYGTLVAEVAKTCTTDGKAAHYVCSICGKIFDSAKKETTGTALVIKASHGETIIKNAKEATATEDGYTGDKECKDCGNVSEKGTVIHTMTKHEGTAATCTKEGTLTYWTCSAESCKDKFYADEKGTAVLTTVVAPIDADNHGETEIKGAKEATATEKGYTGDEVCKDCDSVVKAGEDIPALGGSNTGSDSNTGSTPSGNGSTTPSSSSGNSTNSESKSEQSSSSSTSSDTMPSSSKPNSTNSGFTEKPTNPSTGVAVAVVPVLLAVGAVAAVVMKKKR